jgi:hypothetical protein
MSLYWAGHALIFLFLKDRRSVARLTRERAAGLIDDPAIRQYLGQRAAEARKCRLL